MSDLRAFTMPKWGIEMSEGSISEWMVQEGSAFSKGDVLLSIETDKIVNDVEADYDGTCLRIVAEANADYPVGALLAVFGDPDVSAEDLDAFIANFKPAGDYHDEPQSSLDLEPDQQPTEQNGEGELINTVELPEGISISKAARQFVLQRSMDIKELSGSGAKGRILLQDVEQSYLGAKPAYGDGSVLDNQVPENLQTSDQATPVTLRLAQQNSIDISSISGSGKGSRVRRRDLELTAGPKLASGEVITTSFSRMRGHIAERLTRSHNDIPHYYLQTQVDVNELVRQRDDYNNKAETHATINDVVLLATARSLALNPGVNIHVEDNAVKTFGDVNVAIAVAIEDGLITPVIQQASQMSLAELSGEAHRLIQGARSGTLSLMEYGRGTFTVSNLGMHGINEFTSIINPPQAAILSVGMFQRLPREVEQGIEFGWQVSLTMACDHRAIDGTIGTKMLSSLKALLEAPGPLFRI